MNVPPGGRLPLFGTVTTTGATTGVYSPAASTKTFQATAVASTGTGNFTAQVQGSMRGTYWDTLGTITLTSATTAGMSDGFTSEDRYSYYRANITALSSNITPTLDMGS